jgi:hypothetical protein
MRVRARLRMVRRGALIDRCVARGVILRLPVHIAVGTCWYQMNIDYQNQSQYEKWSD